MATHQGTKPNKGFFSRRKVRRLFWRTFLIALGIAIGILWRPSLISDPEKRAQVEGLRDQLLEANERGQERALEVLGESTEAVKEGVNKAADVAGGITNTDPQVIIQEKITTITEEVKSLPEKEVKKIKLEFCKDVIEEIEVSCRAE